MSKILSLFLLLFLFIGFQGVAQQKIVLVIDVGHGGRDPGNLAVGKKMINEKYLNLKIAKKFGAYVKKHLKNVKVIYTRKTDKYVSLEDRTDIANDNNADLFISIHCNSNPDTAIYGTRIHIHSEKNKKAVRFAKSIDNQFTTRAARKSIGVCDRRFRGYDLFVVKRTNMTALLIETGFMSNPAEEKYLNTTYGQDIIASAIFRGFREYIKKILPKKKTRTKKTGLIYKVQISASPVKLSKSKFKHLKMKVDESYYKQNKYKYKYTVGNAKSFGEANKLRRKVAKKGFKDAFVITEKK